MLINGRELSGRELEYEFWKDFDDKLERGELTGAQALEAINATLGGLSKSSEAGHAALQDALKKV